MEDGESKREGEMDPELRKLGRENQKTANQIEMWAEEETVKASEDSVQC